MAAFLNVMSALAPPAGAHAVGGGIFGFFSLREVGPLRLVSRHLLADVTYTGWDDGATRISGSLARWRRMFANPVAANLSNRHDLRDADFLSHIAGVKKLDMRGCSGITDAGLAPLRFAPLQLLDISGCTAISAAGIRLLQGPVGARLPHRIPKLVMTGCDGGAIEEAQRCGHAVFLLQRVPAGAGPAAVAPPPPPLLAGGRVADEFECALALTAAFEAGALQPTAGGVVVGDSLLNYLGVLLHVSPMRVANLANGTAGAAAPLSHAFRREYARVGGRRP